MTKILPTLALLSQMKGECEKKLAQGSWERRYWAIVHAIDGVIPLDMTATLSGYRMALDRRGRRIPLHETEAQKKTRLRAKAKARLLRAIIKEARDTAPEPEEHDEFGDDQW